MGEVILSIYKIDYDDALEGWQSNGWTVKNSNGTIKSKGGNILSNGGRVLNSTVIDSDLLKARKKALKILDKIKWKNKYYRRDIGFRVIK